MTYIITYVSFAIMYDKSLLWRTIYHANQTIFIIFISIQIKQRIVKDLQLKKLINVVIFHSVVYLLWKLKYFSTSLNEMLTASRQPIWIGFMLCTIIFGLIYVTWKKK